MKLMAEVVVVLKPIANILISLAKTELGLAWGVKTEIGKLSSAVSTIRAVVADAQVKQIKDRAIQEWLIKLKHAAYDAQDILDDLAIDEPELLQTHQSNETGETCFNWVWISCLSLFTNLKRLVPHYKIANKIKPVRERFDRIVNEMSNFGLIRGVVDHVGGAAVPPPSISEGRVTSSASAEPQMYGRDADKENIIKMLLENVNYEHGISVCPILGIGGLGKTTLAQFVYNDDRVQKHFEVKIWICVSDHFNVKRVLKEIVGIVTKRSFDHDNLDVIRDGVLEQLRGKRFLLVLDDVWSDKQDDWNMLKNSLIYGAKGSSIIVTTRLQTVASIVKTVSEPYRLEGLSEDDCWSLFAFYAFEAGKESVNPNLKTIGKEIVKKCGGLPLAAKALGSLLRFTVEERQWREVRDSEIWDLEEEEGNQSHKILSALRLSYNNLSPLARQCFAYCCFFPKDYKMRKEELVNLWFANGLLDFKNKEPEDVGENVFIELKLHSFFQDIEENVNWITFKIHDLVHDLASSVMEREHKHIEAKVGEVRNTINSIETQNPEIRLRHMSTTLLPSSQSSLGGVSDIHPLNLFQQHPLRTLILFSNGGDMEIYSHDMLTISGLKRLKALKIGEWGCGFRIESLPLAFGDKLKHLRYLNLCCCGLSSLQAVSFDGMKNLQVLDLSWNRIDVIPDSIGSLECLRHLNISNNNNDRLKLLPESLGNLTKLETLKLNGCKALKMLPQNTSKLCSLKRLENEDCLSLRGMPSGLGQGLSRLEKLSWWPWVCGRGESENMEELRGLSLLGGALEIRMLGLSIENNVAHNNSLHDVKEEEVLTNKTNLSQLRIYFDIGAGYIDEGGSEQLLQVLKPPSNIESFVLKRYGGRRFPAWMQMRDPGSSFPRLRRIELDGIINVEEWWLNWRENECLPALQDLNISYCRILKALPEELGNLTTLKSLLISSCGALLSVPPCLLKLTSLETLSIICCPRVRSMPKLHLMTSLKRLNILDCPQLEFVFHGLRHLTSLQDLWIDGCPGVVLPEADLDSLVALRGPSFLKDTCMCFYLFLHVIVHIIKAIDQSVVY